jgi:monoterpene epsilon-lactone hydrolase
MPSDAFQETVKAIPELLVEPAGLADDELNLNALRLFMSTSKFKASDSTEVRKVSAGGVPAEWIIESGAETDKRMAFFHGGGFVAGKLGSRRPFTSWVSKATGCSVLLVDYRLAPEHPFPAAVEDAFSSYRWMCKNGPCGEGPASKTFIGGDSAGGCLALSTLLGLRDANEDLPNAVVTLSAFLDMAVTGKSVANRAGLDLLFKPSHLKKFAELYLAGQDPLEPSVSPLYGDISGLPPILMQVGDAELLLDDSVRFAEKAEKAGVEVTLEVWPEMFHIWQMFGPVFPEAQQAIDRIGEFIRSF